MINCTTREELPDPPLPDHIIYLRIPVLDSTVTNISQFFHSTTDTVRRVGLVQYSYSFIEYLYIGLQYISYR